MRLLLDENFPADFADAFSAHVVLTVHCLGWEGAVNGELLRRVRGVCDVFVTLDRNLVFQQNIKMFRPICLRTISEVLPWSCKIASIEATALNIS